MNINDLTLGQIKEIQSLKLGEASESTLSKYKYQYPIDRNVIVRTVTMIYTGKLVEVTPTNLVLVDCSWIPETERFMQFVAEGKVRECEPYPDGLPVFINRGSLIDMCELVKPLPRSQK